MSLTSTSIKRAFAIALVLLLADTAYAQTSDSDWTTYNRTYAGERFSPLKEITTANVGQLRTVCTYDTGETVGFQTGPLVTGGVMYFTTWLCLKSHLDTVSTGSGSDLVKRGSQ